MALYDKEVKELNKNSRKMFIENRSRTSRQKNMNKFRSQAQNEIVLGTEYLGLNNQSDLHFNGLDMQPVGTIPSPDEYPELSKYFSFDSIVEADSRREDLDTRPNQSLDDFFQDFNEIISSEMKPTTTSYDQGHHSVATNSIPYIDQSSGFNSNASGVDFNLDLTQFFCINTNESDFLNADEIKTDFSNGLVHFPEPQYTYQDKSVDDYPEFSVIDLSNANTKMSGNTKYSSTNQIGDNQQELAVKDFPDQSSQMADYSDTKISVSTPLNQFYLDFKSNGDVASASNEDNSIVTYISKDSLQSVEYINESGQTETVMYVDHQPDGIRNEKNCSSITQYEIINIDNYPYPADNVDALQHTKTVELIPDSRSVQYYGENVDVVGAQTDILSTLLSDKNNKVTLISRPMRNPKVRQCTDEFYLKFEEIDNNPTKIVFSNQPKVKSCRKQKHETINQIDLEVPETKRNRSKTNAPIIPAMGTFIPETPKLRSKYMIDRRNNTRTRRKRPRKLFWDSESDCENGEQSIDIIN